MLKELYPRDHWRFVSLPVLGAVLGEFEPWLLEKEYCRGARRQKFKDAVRIERFLSRRGLKGTADITRAHLESCRVWYRLRNPSTAGTANSLSRFLEERGLLPPSGPVRSTPSDIQVEAYKAYLRDVRGFSSSSCKHHEFTARKFLEHVGHDAKPSRLPRVGAKDVEKFVRVRGLCLRRGSLQHTVSHLRGFLRFLATISVIQPGLDAQIDTPRLYRLEQLPRAFPWRTVRSFLASINRRTPMGLRDYRIVWV